MTHNIDDVRDFDGMLKRRGAMFREEKLRDWLAGKSLTLAEARISRVLIPMEGVYTPGFQALPASSWSFVELITREGLVGTGEWSIDLDDDVRLCLDRLQQDSHHNLLDLAYEYPLYIAWWDLVGQVLEKPLHRLWTELFERDIDPPTRIPMAAYTWQRFPDAAGNHEVTFETWPEHCRQRAEMGFPAIKMSCSAYQPEDHIEVIHRVRDAIGPDVRLRFDPHGTWNLAEARHILRAVQDCNIELAEQPICSLLPQCFYPKGEPVPTRPAEAGGFQAEYYFRYMTQLRQEQSIPLSCHWWTPPIVNPPGAPISTNQWEPNWALMEKYDAADVSSPDMGLGVWGLWRIYELARFMGMEVLLHSNFELCTQMSFRCALCSSLMMDVQSHGLYMGNAPRGCHPIDNETIQITDDVVESGRIDFTGGHFELTEKPGHGQRLDPQRIEKYRYCEEAVAPHRAYAKQIYADYRIDRPRRTALSGWPKPPGAETFDRQSYPYDLSKVLGAIEHQDVDMALNK